jgi:hypothetical protein
MGGTLAPVAAVAALVAAQALRRSAPGAALACAW